MSRTTCTYHCRGYPFGGCDSHFTSLNAFDAHRQGPQDGQRECVDPAEVDRLELLTRDGHCAHIRPGPRDGVTVWRMVLSEKQKAALEQIRRNTPAPPSATRPGAETPSETPL